jgi:beta-N-acetylhexosaminidase
MKLPRSHHLKPKEIAGQMLMPAVHLHFMNKENARVLRLIRLIQRFHPGGFILFGEHPSDIQYWVQRLQEASKYPLLIGADLERGAGSLFKHGSTLPHALAWGAADSPALVREAATVIAQEAKVLGINTIFAPVLDLVNEPENPIINIRGFHSDRNKVAEMGKIFIETVQQHGLACVAKHFPGHGRSLQDSHLEMPIIPCPIDELKDTDIYPFKEAIKSGVKGIMSAHIRVKNRKLPVTLDPHIMNEEIRQKSSFTGLIFSDALNMKAISTHFHIIDQVELGMKAGLDIFLMPDNISYYHAMLMELLEKNKILRLSAQNSVERIFALKKWIHRSNPDVSHHAGIYKILESPGHQAISHKLADASVTCIHKTDKFPLDLVNIKRCHHIVFTDFDPKDNPLNIFRKKIADFFDEVYTRVNPTNETIKDDSLRNSDIFIISIYSRTFGGHVSNFNWPRINETVRILTEQNKFIVILVFGNPFVIRQLKYYENCTAVLLLYSYVESSQTAAFNALCSFIPIKGQLPVSLGPDFLSTTIPEKPYTIQQYDTKEFDFSGLDKYIQQSIQKKIFPGGVLHIVKEGTSIYTKAYGRFDYDSRSPEVDIDTRYDLASLTKVLATTAAVLLLVQSKMINLDDKLSWFYHKLKKKQLGQATIGDLLMHQAGLSAWKPFYENCRNKDDVLSQILQIELEYEIGKKSVYSDLGFILLGDIIERISGLPLDVFCRDKIFQPMGLSTLSYLPVDNVKNKKSKRSIVQSKEIPPTGFDNFRDRIIRGEVYDTNCYVMGGIAGHAGLFGEVTNVSAMAQLFLQKGIYNKIRILKYNIADLAIKKLNPRISNRSLGWDTPSVKSTAGRYYSADSFGHLAYTGPSIWADPEKNLIVTFLCNRTHPDPQKNRMDIFRPKLHDLIINSLKNNTIL